MTELWTEIDAVPRGDRGEISATMIVGGIPLVVRQLRLAGRLGWAGARIRVPDARGADTLGRSLARFPAPHGLAVEILVATPAGDGHAPEGSSIRLLGTALYARETLAGARPGDSPPALLELRTRADARAAEALLFASIRKSAALDGVLSYYVIRPLTRPIVRLLVNTPVTPNQVTLCALGCGLAAAILAGFGGATRTALAGALYWLGGFLDHLDGDLARLRITSSRLGEWLDSMTDETATYSLAAGLGIGLWRDGQGAGWAGLGLATAVVGALAVGPLYLELHRRHLPIDTAQFPWFFQEGSGDAARRGPLGHAINGVGFLVRRDVNTTAVAILLVLGLRAPTLALTALAATIAAGVTLTHYAVVAARRRAA